MIQISSEKLRGNATVMAVFLFVSVVLMMFGKDIAALASNMNSLQRIGVMCFLLVLIIYIFTFMVHILKVMKKDNEPIWLRVLAFLMNIIILAVLSLDFSILTTNINIGEIDLEKIQAKIFLILNASTAVAILSITITLLDNIVANVGKSLKSNEKLTLIVATISAVVALIAVLKS